MTGGTFSFLTESPLGGPASPSHHPAGVQLNAPVRLMEKEMSRPAATVKTITKTAAPVSGESIRFSAQLG